MISRGKNDRKSPPINENEKNQQLVGILEKRKKAGVIWPVHRKAKFHSFRLEQEQIKDFEHGDILKFKVNNEKVTEVTHIGHLDDEFIYGTIAQMSRDLGQPFKDDSLKLANSGTVPNTKQHKDLRDLSFVTIDGETAKDFDDAVYATQRDGGGWNLLVAIADVSYYVPVDSSLDEDAFAKSNSVYLADRVLPMLPEALSNGVCSLRPNEDKGTLICDMVLDKKGTVTSYSFRRALICSQARLTYTEMFNAKNGEHTKQTKKLWDPTLKNLWGCFETINKEIQSRGTLDLDLAEYIVTFEQGHSTIHIEEAERNQSHKLIEAFMVAANVCAADCLLKAKVDGVFRIHEEPNMVKVQTLKEFLDGMKIHQGTVKDASGSDIKANTPMKLFSYYLQHAKGGPFEGLVSELVLRSQAQAKYAENNIGHFGLNLKAYTHFTSPIRRYADLIVHRALIKACNLGDGGHIYENEKLIEIAGFISTQERLAIEAERETQERYCLDALIRRVGDVCDARISGVNMSGIFIRILGTPIDGFIPKRLLPGDFYNLEEQKHRYIGRRTKRVFQLGNILKIRIADVDPIMQKIMVDLVDEKPKKTNKEKTLKGNNAFSTNEKESKLKRKKSKSRKSKGKRDNPIKAVSDTVSSSDEVIKTSDKKSKVRIKF